MFVSDWSILLKFGLRRVYLVHFFIPYVGSSENDAWVLTG